MRLIFRRIFINFWEYRIIIPNEVLRKWYMSAKDALKFESKVSRVNYCNNCRENGVSFICVVCGGVTIKTRLTGFILENLIIYGDVRDVRLLQLRRKRKEKRQYRTYANMPDDHPVKDQCTQAYEVYTQRPTYRLNDLNSKVWRAQRAYRKSAIKQFSDPAKREQANRPR